MEPTTSQGTNAHLAVDEALSYLRQAEHLGAEIDQLGRADLEDRHVRRDLAEARRQYGHALKLADIHSNLAIAEEFRALREDLNAEPPPLGVAPAPTRRPRPAWMADPKWNDVL